MSFTRGSLHRADALDQYPEKSSILEDDGRQQLGRAVGYDLRGTLLRRSEGCGG